MDKARKVLITGSSGYCGHVIAAHLAGRGVPVVGLDVEPPRAGAERPGFTFEHVDVRHRGQVERVFATHEPTHVIHLAFRIDPTHDPEADRVLNVEGSRNVGDACFGAPSIRQAVLMSSISVYGAHEDNPEWIDEDQPMRPGGYAYAEHKKQCEAQWRALAKRAGRNLVILRMCTVAGPSCTKPGGVVRTIARSPLLPSIMGGDGRIQLIHEQDLAELVDRVIHDEEASGTFNLCPDSFSTIRALGRTQGRPSVPVPLPVLRALLGLLWRLRIGGAAPEAAPLLAHGIVASPARLVDRYGYSFRYGTREAFLDAVEKRRLRGTL
ncbi:MAG: NAD-dependent epimerase/dehydratase family protein [Deltaproteobacteria bacterium]|nr:NAD-dependent epimerase/dehydratase family protein [Deltaproteobacteria bacterium]